MRLFGHILPFIGFRTLEWWEIDEHEIIHEGTQEVFEVEWFGRGVRLLEKEPQAYKARSDADLAKKG